MWTWVLMELELILTELQRFKLSRSRQFMHGRVWSFCNKHNEDVHMGF